MAVVRSFLMWAIETHLSAVLSSPTDLAKALSTVERAFRAHRIPQPVPSRRYGLSREEVAHLLATIHPDSLCNPFRQPSRQRNFLLIRLLLETGIRRGELCKLRLEDINTRGAGPFIRVARQPDDPRDKRRREPRVKTRERRIPIGGELCRLLIGYIARRPAAASHPYLFLSTRSADPLTMDGVTEVFLHVRRRVERVGNVDFTPHTLRRTFNDRLLESARTGAWTEQQVHDSQNYLNGWSEQSRQGAVYARRFVGQSAMEIAQAMQQGLYELEPRT